MNVKYLNQMIDKRLHVCIDINPSFYDIKCIYEYINIYFKVLYNDNELEVVNHTITHNSQNDIIQNGIVGLNKIEKKVKEMNKDNMILYISIGNIYKTNDNGTIILLNDDVKTNCCYYVINKRKLRVNKKSNKKEKLMELQILKQSLDYMMGEKKKISYNKNICN